MNHIENPSDTALFRQLRESLSQLDAPERPPVATITSRGRAHQRRRFASISGLGIISAALATVMALGLAGAFGANPAPSTSASRIGVHARSKGTGARTIRTPAFVLTSNVNGTATLSLTMSQMLDPAELQQALSQYGIPALVKTGTYCSSQPAAPDPVSVGVLAVQLPTGVPHTMVPAGSVPAPSELKEMAARTVTVINPAALPSGTELFFGYSTSIHAVFTDLIYSDSYTCGSNP
jgi:hypothetical protein